MEEASAHPVGAPLANRGVCFLPFWRAIPALIERKLAEIGGDTARRRENPRTGRHVVYPSAREAGAGDRSVPFLASSHEWRTARVV